MGDLPVDAFVNIRDYLETVPKDVPWLYEGLVAFGYLTLVAGIWKGGKTTFVAQLMGACEGKNQFLGHFVPRTQVILVTEEAGVPVARKYGQLEQLRLVDRQQAAKHGLSGDLETLVMTLAAICEEYEHPPLIVVDTFAKYSGVEEENSNSEVGATMEAFALLATLTGAAVVVIDHVNKQGGTHGRAIRGGSAKAAASDANVVFDYGAGKYDRTLAIESRLNDEHMTWTVTFDPETRLYGAPNAANEQADESTYDRLTNGIPVSGDGMDINELRALWEVSLNTAKGIRDKLLQEGRMRRAYVKVGRTHKWLYWAQLPMVNPDEEDGHEDE